ncbi:hypothetical protein SODALDRAFT_333238 [Sodiomyces alkalinus F11]|uniref:Ribosomal RNA-processing protein 8 n=1 Tax=Sodiomyces alkalinus (strain CBS 110278 / VKM F-3762 / F11) TaxID=1314773 RepID=A0A3N2PW74_SODAK|nr:hypothetical protein SODALDRAFT_333238 [Sodiomyces alkalinus F11]ROT38626.1 hypothetical protein SODALDRAFT_333238 [Sodiomyces alkalinus F11]
MFSVKGWSVSAENLKLEKQAKKKDDAETKSHKKRKRTAHNTNVTDANIADLWESVIEGKKPVNKKANDKKPRGRARDGREKKGGDDTAADTSSVPTGLAPDVGTNGDQGDEDSWDGINDQDETSPKKPGSEEQPPPKKLKTEKQQKQNGKDKPKNRKLEKDAKAKPGDRATTTSGDKPQSDPSHDEHDAPSTKPKEATSVSPAAAKYAALSTAPPLPPPAAKLTPLQASMRAKLVSARFRHLNETLYTRPSAEALRLFEESPEMFSEYHEGFRRQVEVWPENPVDGYIRDIRLRAKQQPYPPKGKKPGNHQNGAGASDLLPALPHTDRVTTIADLGCGDARLAATLLPEARKLRLAIHSFDLHNPSPHVTRADIANLPLANGAVDIAIFCLALMGTNWLDFVEEAYRILRWKGELWVAEIKSRFGNPAAAQKGQKGQRPGGPVSHSVGARKKKLQLPAKKGGDPEGGPATDTDRQDLAVEVDGAEDRRRETDVSAFVEALLKRGFVLHGEPDMSNKMFVRMLFVKAAPPTKGKCVVPADAAKEAAARNKKQKRFVWEEQGADGVDEGSILKPCVYKLR